MFKAPNPDLIALLLNEEPEETKVSKNNDSNTSENSGKMKDKSASPSNFR